MSQRKTNHFNMWISTLNATAAKVPIVLPVSTLKIKLNFSSLISCHYVKQDQRSIDPKGYAKQFSFIKGSRGHWSNRREGQDKLDQSVGTQEAEVSSFIKIQVDLAEL